MMHTISRLWQKHGMVVLLSSILLLATIIRWPMIYFALPYTPHPDEPYVINMIFDMMVRNTWIPNNFDRPHLSVYLSYLAVWIGTWWHPIDPALLQIPTDRITVVGSAFVDARIAMVLSGVLSIYTAFWHMHQRGLAWGAWIGMLWLTLLPWHQAQSGYITPDVMVGFATFFLAGTCWMYAQQMTSRNLWLVAVAIGIATGTKYNLGAALLVPAVMQWPLLQQRQWRELVRNAAILAIGSAVTFLITTPGIVVSLNELQSSLGYQMEHYSRPDSNYAPWEWQYYLWFFQHEGWLWIGSLLACAGIIKCLKERRLVDIGLLLFFVFELLFFMSRERHYMRNLMPLVVYGAVYIVIGGAWLVQLLQRWIPNVMTRIVLVSCVILVQPVQQSLANYTFMQRPYNLLLVDAYSDTQPHGGIFLCTFELITAANTPSCDAIINHPQELQHWQAAGVQQLVVNRTQFASLAVPTQWELVRQIPGSKQGGSGDPYDIYRNTQITATVIGTAASTSDGITILGVRLGYGEIRNRITPLASDTRLVPSGDVLNINGYFTVQTPVSEPGWWLFVHILDAKGIKVAERATPPRTDYPIARWQAGEQVVVNADIPVILPAGDYTLVLGFFRPSDGARMIIDRSNDGTWSVPFRVIR